MKKIMLILTVWVAIASSVKAQTVSDDGRSDKNNQSKKSNSFGDWFTEVSKFEKGTGVWSLSMAVRTDVDKHGYSIKNKIPAVTLSYEKSIGSNLGLGGRVGYNQWDIMDSKCKTHYYALSIRGSYHINIGEKIDPYLGIAASLRGATTVDENSTLTTIKPGVSSFIGVRYYFMERLAIFGEAGADMMGWFHFGLTLKF